MVLACYPELFCSEKYIRDYKKTYDGCPNAPAPRPEPYAWPGPWGWQFVWSDLNPSLYQPTSTHPLRVFWESFVERLKDYFGESNPKFQKLVFDVMDEPLGGLQGGDNNEAPWLSVPNQAGNGVSWRDRWVNACKNWRKIQLNAIVGIQAKSGDATIIATSYDAFPESYVDYDTVANDTTNPRKFPVYTSAYQESECTTKYLYYHTHIYEPFRYTHWALNQNPPLYADYVQSRDYDGVDDNPNDGISVPQFDSQYYPLKGTIWLAMSWLTTWRLENGTPNMIITGFGADEHAYYNNFDHGQGNFGVGPPPSCSPPPTTTTGSSTKAQWLYDVRYNGEKLGMSWCVFDYLGSFQIYNGDKSMSWPWALFYYRRSCHPRTIIPKYSDGLFGQDRPL